MLGDQHSGHEKIDKAVPAFQLGHLLLIQGNRTPLNSEYLEKFVPKRLILPALPGFIFPGTGEFHRKVTNIVPNQGHFIVPSYRLKRGGANTSPEKRG